MSLKYPMLRLWLYELGWITSWGISLSVVNDLLQTVLLIIGIVSGILAIRQTIKNKKQ